MLKQGQFPVDHVVNKTITMDDAGDVIADWNKNPGKYTKIIVDLRNKFIFLTTKDTKTTKYFPLPPPCQGGGLGEVLASLRHCEI